MGNPFSRIYILKAIFLVILFSFLLNLNLFAKSDTYKTDIVVDGTTSDFDSAADQILLSQDLIGKFYESESDSKWGSYNDINSIKLTWDSGYLYIGVDGIIENNNMILYIDTDDTKGVNDVSSLDNWKRKIKFKNIKPDFFLASWDKNTTSPQLWQINSSSSASDKSSDITGAASFNGTIAGAMEARIPWTTLYNLGWGEVKTNAVLKIVGLVVGGDDSSGPDSAPDSSVDMPVDSSSEVTLDNYLIINVDKNSDGKPDIGVDIRSQSDVAIDITSLKYQPLNIVNVNINNQSFSPNDDGINDTVIINYSLTKDADVTANIFNLNGDLIYTLQNSVSLTKGEQQLEWNGFDNSNIKSPVGFYIVHIKATTQGVSVVKKIGIYLIN